ncbi:hypothetical protein, partial [uncultured Mycobacterium sp.]|uniref:DUF7373 family lipoprotein n=1 Tax=uncultured Mycobacterium sp. TaxID=171292 RepID=UPI0035C98760
MMTQHPLSPVRSLVVGAVCAAAAACAAVLVAGCTMEMDGRAIKAADAPPAGVEVALLDPGNYPKKPGRALGKVPSEAAGRNIEAQRMANNVVAPWEVDATLLAPVANTTTVLPKAENIAAILADPVPATAAAHNYLLGFSTERSSVRPTPPERAKILLNMVLRFASPQDAAAAAGDMAAQDQSASFRTTPANPIAIPRYPATLATVTNIDNGFDVEAFTAHGPYVFYQFAGSKESADIAAQLVTDTLDMQGPLIDRFMPTPADQFATLPLDPTGLLARTVPTPTATINQVAVYEPRAALNYAADPRRAQDMFHSAGVQHISVNRTTVYQAIDATGAARAF